MKNFLLSLLLFAAGVGLAATPTRLSLKDCVSLAVEKNINVQTANIEKEKTDAKKSEVKAALFPKVNLNSSFTDNLKLPTTVLPGDFLGQPGHDIAMQMGSKYSASAMLQISQVLYNQTAITALKLSKKTNDLNRLNIDKAREEVALQVAKMYALAQTTSEQLKLVQQNVDRTEQLRKITNVTVENGVGKQIDLDRVDVNLENMYTQLRNTKAAQEQQMNTIKYLLQLPLDTEIELTDSVNTSFAASQPGLRTDFSGNTNIRLLELQKDLYGLNHKMTKDAYLPTLSLSGQAAYQGLQSKFSKYFAADSKWFPYANFTVTLSVPVFDGFEKRSKKRQASLDYQKAQLTLNDTKEAINLDYRNTLNTYLNNKANIDRQKQNLRLAEKVYRETSLRYNQGTASMNALLQDESGMNDAQANYLTALYNFKDSELKIMSLTGDINKLIRQ